ncbi:HNH endonuclease signature motif containing protein [Streptomyces sp. NPDC005406]|uniref:HNH endonuclease n=1 Tax=Streptomyces sp. NPDC005406 TaxID=3155339 RepID=UPI00345708F8
MWPLDPPAFSARSTWEACTKLSRDTVGNDGLGTKLRAAAGTAEEAAETFRAAAQSRTLHNLQDHRFKIDGIPAKRVADIVYGSGMIKGPGRDVYDALMDAPEDELCPLCRHSDVTQLDHVMPKATFPALCVAPENLVPVCSSCNHIKNDRAPKNAEDVLLHPYFEHAGTATWLDAELATSALDAGRLTYFVNPPPDWDGTFTARLRRQFTFLELGRRYSVKANQTLKGIHHHLVAQLRSGREAAVRTHLTDMATSHLAADPNGWAGVAYRTWAANDEFCQGRFW